MNKKTRNVLIGIGVIAALVFFSYPSELERCIEAREPEVLIYREVMWNDLDLSDAFMKCVEDKKDMTLESQKWAGARIGIFAKERDKIRSECLSEHEEDQRTMSRWLDNETRTKATKVCNAQGIY